MGKSDGPLGNTSRPLRMYEADRGAGMTFTEAGKFLTKSRSVIRLGTVDDSGDANIHPVWYYYAPKRQKLYAFVGKKTRKARNIEKRHGVYFEVDDDRWPYKGVRGKGEARELAEGREMLAIAAKILVRYVRKGHPMFASFIDSARKGSYVVVEITPSYFSTWDYGKMPPGALRAGLK